jgi:thiamine biosynthesis lipoprotein ApbE
MKNGRHQTFPTSFQKLSETFSLQKKPYPPIVGAVAVVVVVVEILLIGNVKQQQQQMQLLKVVANESSTLTRINRNGESNKWKQLDPSFTKIRMTAPNSRAPYLV